MAKFPQKLKRLLQKPEQISECTAGIYIKMQLGGIVIDLNPEILCEERICVGDMFFSPSTIYMELDPKGEAAYKPAFCTQIIIDHGLKSICSASLNR